jgi:TonB-linked SusC/RagA family outer membrane protein
MKNYNRWEYYIPFQRIKKLELAMKISFILMFFCMLQLHANTYSQKKTTIDLSVRNMKVKDVLRIIESKTNFRFFFNENLSELDISRTLSANKENIEILLDQLFTKTTISYRILANDVVIIAPAVNLQQQEITGKVTDVATGEALPGVSIGIEGTSTGVTTDLNGKYTLKVPEKNDVIIFSFIGYLSERIPYTGQSALDISLVPDVKALEEVVVIGYGTIKRRDLTGAVTTIKAQEITSRPGPNAMEALQGRVAGLDIVRTSGQAGAGVTLQLRGKRSFKASGDPLFLIDGLPGDYSTINANDIETIEVLKDASSTAVYGSAGSNGVIIITTKNAKPGKLTIDFNSYYGYNGWSITPKMRTGESYLQTKRDAYKYVWDPSQSAWTTTGALWQSAADDETIFGTSRYAIYQEGKSVDWAKLFLQKNAATQNYSLSVSGGNDKTKGYVSFNYTDENGQYRGDDYKLYSTSMRVDHNVKKWLTVGSSLQASYLDRNVAQDKLENALTTDPLVRPYNDDGTLNTNLGNNVYNLLLDYQPGVYENNDNNLKLYLNPYIEIKPIKGLSLLSRANIRMNYSNNYRFDGIGSVSYTYANAGIAKAKLEQDRSYGYQWENILTYNFKIAQNHDFTITGVSTWNYNQDLKTSMTQTNIKSNDIKWYNFTNDVNTTSASSYSMYKTLGYVGRLNYSFNGKYLFSASIRHDGSSVLYKTNRWDNFPAFSAGWKISEEAFMSNTKNWMDNMKIRVGWGVTGSAAIEPYSSANNLVSTNMSLGGTAESIYRNSQYLTNPDLGWEKSYNSNFGLDLNMFRNRIELALDYYITKTDGVIWDKDLPAIYGTYTPGVAYKTYLNMCETKNRGVEVSLNTRNIITKNFEWTTTFTFSENKEEILKLTGGTSNNITNGSYSLSIGEPINSFRNYKLDGVWQIGQEKDAAVFGKRPGDLKVNVPGMTRVGEGVYLKTTTATGGAQTRTYYYTNLATAQQYDATLTAASLKYTVSANDYQVLGHNSPDWSFGFQNGFKYKNFDLGVYMYFRWGQMISYNMLGWYQPNGFATNASPSRTIPVYFNYWTPENPSNDFPVMNYAETSSTITGFTGLSYVDGSFFKIKNITLGYTLPSSGLLKKVSLKKFRLYGTITNPLIVAKSHLLKQYDPEMNGSLSYPLTKQVVVGLNVTF